MVNGVFGVQTNQVAKLLHYVSSLRTATSDEPPVAKPELMANIAAITTYFQKPSAMNICEDTKMKTRVTCCRSLHYLSETAR